MSSPNALWAIANQLQLLLLLIAMNVYLPKDVVEFITANAFANLSLDFIPFDKIKFINVSIDWFDADHFEPKYENIGHESGSTFVNLISMMSTMLLLGGLHLCIA